MSALIVAPYGSTMIARLEAGYYFFSAAKSVTSKAPPRQWIQKPTKSSLCHDAPQSPQSIWNRASLVTFSRHLPPESLLPDLVQLMDSNCNIRLLAVLLPILRPHQLLAFVEQSRCSVHPFGISPFTLQRNILSIHHMNSYSSIVPFMIFTAYATIWMFFLV